MRSDVELNELARQLPGTLYRLVTGRRPPCRYHAASLTLKQIERRTDEVLRPSDPREPWWVVEWQFRRDPATEHRLLLEGLLLAAQEGLRGKLRLAAVYSTRSVARASLPVMLDPGGEQVAFRPVRVVLGDLAPEALLARGPEMFPLLALSRAGKAELDAGLARWWGQVRRALPRQTRRLERLREQLCHLYSARFGANLETILKTRGPFMKFEETRVGRDLITLGERKGERKGEKKGEKKGLVEAILRVIASRFGRPPSSALARAIQSCRTRRLRALVSRAVEAPDLESFRRQVRGTR